MAESTGYAAARMRKFLAQLPYLPRALALVWAAAGAWTTAWALLLLVQGLLPVATVLITRSLVNALVEAIRTGGAGGALQPALVQMALMGAVMLLTEILGSVTGWIRAAQSELVHDHIQGLIHRQSLAVDLAFYESPDFYDHLHRARSEASYRPMALVESLGNLLQSAITLAAMGVVLIPFGPWLPLALLVSTLPAFSVVMRYVQRQHSWRRRTTPDQRRAWYYDWVLTAPETAAELRLFGAGGHFESLYQNLRRRLRNERLDIARRQSVAEMGAGVVALSVFGGSLAWMAWRAVRGLVTLGDLALFYQAFNQGLRLMRSLLGNVGQLYANILFLGNLFEFLAMEPQVLSPPRPSPAPAALGQGIRFHQVTFHYPGSRRLALDAFSLEVPAGHVAAIVGANGAGKSTLIKLLCRFYDPDSGSIEVDGLDLRRLELDHVRRLVTVLFQQPVHYNATVAENIALGNLSGTPEPEAIEAAARAAGADQSIARLPKQYDQHLGKWFTEGAELSVGEWQRIALARAFLRPAPILALDEPTSAMDPWAEADWLDRFRHLAAGRTALIVTHRFTTAMYADRIHVMDDGRIVESGCHQELLALGGKYAMGWKKQQR